MALQSVSPLQNSLLALAVARAVTTAYYAICCRSLRPVPGEPIRIFDRAHLRPLLRFGGWVSVSNGAGPLLKNLDRIVLTVVGGASAVGQYSAIHEIITKANALPFAITSALFPRLARDFATRNTASGSQVNRVAVILFVTICLPLTLLAAFATPLLTYWLGGAYLPLHAEILRLLSIGVIFNGIALLPLSVLHASGEAAIPAKLHLVQLPLFAAAVVGLVHIFGLPGAAMAWALRVTVDCIGLWFFSARLLEPARAGHVAMICSGVAFAVFSVAVMLSSAAVLAAVGFLSCLAALLLLRVGPVPQPVAAGATVGGENIR